MNATGTSTATIWPDPGGLVRVRRATTADREPLRRMFDRCSAETRYRRFHGPVKAIPASYLTEALSGSAFHYALVAWQQDPDDQAVPSRAPGQPEVSASTAPSSPGRPAGRDDFASASADMALACASGVAASAAGAPPGRAVALASCRLVAEGAAELGLLVEDAWQRQGTGARLLRDLVAYADGIGVRLLEAQILAEQSWITSLLRPYGPCRVRTSRHGVMTVTVRRVTATNAVSQ